MIFLSPISSIVFTEGVQNDLNALLVLLNFTINSFDKSRKLTIVFTNNNTKKSSSCEIYEQFKIHFSEWNKFLMVDFIYDTSELSEIREKYYDKVMILSSLKSVPLKFFKSNNNTFKDVFSMLQKKITYFNINGSSGQFMIKKEIFNKCNTFTKIPISLCNKIYLTSDMIDSMPENFKRENLKKAFENFIDRPCQESPKCYNITFNVDYNTLTNYIKTNSFLENYFKLFKIVDNFKCLFIIISGIIILIIAFLVFNYVDETFNKMFQINDVRMIGCSFMFFTLFIINYLFKLYKKTKTYKSKELQNIYNFYDCINKKPYNYNKEEDIKKLSEMVQVVKFMTGETYLDSKLSYSSLSNIDKAFNNWSKIVSYNKCSLKPSYSLLAVFFMIEDDKMSEEIKKELLDINNSEKLTTVLEKFLIIQKHLMYENWILEYRSGSSPDPKTSKGWRYL
jgi:hypothetical protein